MQAHFQVGRTQRLDIAWTGSQSNFRSIKHRFLTPMAAKSTHTNARISLAEGDATTLKHLISLAGFWQRYVCVLINFWRRSHDLSSGYMFMPNGYLWPCTITAVSHVPLQRPSTCVNGYFKEFIHPMLIEMTFTRDVPSFWLFVNNRASTRILIRQCTRGSAFIDYRCITTSWISAD